MIRSRIVECYLIVREYIIIHIFKQTKQNDYSKYISKYTQKKNKSCDLLNYFLEFEPKTTTI